MSHRLPERDRPWTIRTRAGQPDGADVPSLVRCPEELAGAR